jgi:multisubunit Na+/H+ antiporter MnhC subunit
MEIAALAAVFFAVIAAGVVFFVVRRIVKWAFRLALLAALVVAVLVGAGMLWWKGVSGTNEQPTRRPAATRTTNTR